MRFSKKSPVAERLTGEWEKCLIKSEAAGEKQCPKFAKVNVKVLATEIPQCISGSRYTMEGLNGKYSTTKHQHFSHLPFPCLSLHSPFPF